VKIAVTKSRCSRRDENASEAQATSSDIRCGGIDWSGRFEHESDLVPGLVECCNKLPKATDAKQQAKYLLDYFQGATLRSKLERSGEPIDTFLNVVFSSILVKR
jgi:hypothetical protein